MRSKVVSGGRNMGELDLDKIERTYPGLTCKKHELESVRISTGRAVPRYKRVICRDLNAVSKNATGNISSHNM